MTPAAVATSWYTSYVAAVKGFGFSISENSAGSSLMVSAFASVQSSILKSTGQLISPDVKAGTRYFESELYAASVLATLWKNLKGAVSEFTVADRSTPAHCAIKFTLNEVATEVV